MHLSIRVSPIRRAVVGFAPKGGLQNNQSSMGMIIDDINEGVYHVASANAHP
jgi:hypothetical protein